MTIAMILLVWYVVGVASFIYWWTHDYDFTSREVLVAFVIGVGGPIAFAVGWFLHGGGLSIGYGKRPRLIVRKRER